MTAHQAIDRLKAAGIDIRTAPDSEVVEELTELATELRWSNPAERANKMVAHLQRMSAILEGGE
jgi:predicted Fe-Mo cluster-binding NifX family protein